MLRRSGRLLWLCRRLLRLWLLRLRWWLLRRCLLPWRLGLRFAGLLRWLGRLLCWSRPLLCGLLRRWLGRRRLRLLFRLRLFGGGLRGRCLLDRLRRLDWCRLGHRLCRTCRLFW